jgi:hypothetical protein
MAWQKNRRSIIHIVLILCFMETWLSRNSKNSRGAQLASWIDDYATLT